MTMQHANILWSICYKLYGREKKERNIYHVYEITYYHAI